MRRQNVLFRERALCDAYEQQSAQDWLPLEVTQLSAGSFNGQLREIQHPDVGVYFEQQNCMVHKRGIIDKSFCTVSFARSTNAQVRMSEYDSHDHSLFFIPRGTEVDVQVAANVETVYFRFNQAQFLERARAISPRYWAIAPSDMLSFESALQQPLEAFANCLYANPLFQSGVEVADDNQALCSTIMDRLLLALDASSVSHQPQRDILARRRAKARVSDAIAYIDAALANGNCPSIVDICLELKVSQRNLQYSFQKIVGFTPNAYLYCLRLNRVRVQLSNPDDDKVTVTEVAMYWQFWHLGRFAHDYLHLFGELPSTTLYRALR